MSPPKKKKTKLTLDFGKRNKPPDERDTPVFDRGSSSRESFRMRGLDEYEELIEDEDVRDLTRNGK